MSLHAGVNWSIELERQDDFELSFSSTPLLRITTRTQHVAS